MKKCQTNIQKENYFFRHGMGNQKYYWLIRKKNIALSLSIAALYRYCIIFLYTV